MDENCTKKYIRIKILMILAIILIILSINTNVAFAANPVIETEKNFVRMTVAQSRGADSNNKVNKTTLQEYLDQYSGHKYRATVTEETSTTLLVKFGETGNQYRITIDTGEVTPVFATVTYVVDEGITYSEDVAIGSSALDPTTFTPTKVGWTFVGWSEDVSGDGTVLESKDMGNDPLTLYAIYSKTITLSYSANNGTGTVPSAQTGTRFYYASGNYYDPTFTLASGSGLTRTNYAFNGWNLGAVGENITLTADTTANAVWKATTSNVLTELGVTSIYRAGDNYTYTTNYFDITAFNQLTVTCSGYQSGGGGAYSCYLVTTDGNINLLGTSNTTIDISDYER